eukprot:scaffold355503_cov18-Prasinocladus_malaysianus.AAC.1
MDFDLEAVPYKCSRRSTPTSNLRSNRCRLSSSVRSLRHSGCGLSLEAADGAVLSSSLES